MEVAKLINWEEIYGNDDPDKNNDVDESVESVQLVEMADDAGINQRNDGNAGIGENGRNQWKCVGLLKPMEIDENCGIGKNGGNSWKSCI